MKRVSRLLAATVLYGIVGTMSLDAAQSWTLFGLKDEAVNTILTLSAGNGEDAIMVGTSKGIWNHEYGHWVKVWEGLPVYDMRMAAYDRIVAAVGNGSDSDGIYIGKVVAHGEPGNLWKFKLLVKCSRPTAIEYEPLEFQSVGVTRCSGRLFAGTVSGISSGILCDTTFDALTPLPGPVNPFGLTCASMAFMSEEGMLYAGGNNYRRNLSLVARPDTSWLVKGTSEMIKVGAVQATSLVEVTQNGKRLAVATTDSGVRLYNNGLFTSRIPAPQNEPVFAIVPFTKIQFSGATWTPLVAATTSGVYRQCPPNADCIWSRLDGALPAPVRCLAQFQDKTLWAGTDSGVYRYESSTRVQQQTIAMALPKVHVSAIAAGQGRIRFETGNGDVSSCMVNLFDVQGRCVRSSAVTGKEATFTGLSNGMYCYRVTLNDQDVSSGIIICQK